MHVLQKKGLMIRTGEGVEFSLPLADPIIRAMALLLDLLLFQTVASIVYQALLPLGILAPDATWGLYLVTSFCGGIAYFVFMEWLLRGQTIGKKIFRLQVMDDQGFRLNFYQALMRNLFRTVDMLPVLYLTGGLCSSVHPLRKRLGDIVSNTIVVRRPKLEKPDLGQLKRDKYNTFLTYPHLIGRCRQKISPQLAAIILEAIIRREQLEDSKRVSLYQELVAYFKDLQLFPQEACIGLSDEQYLRNLIEVLYHERKQEKAGKNGLSKSTHSF